MVLGGVGFYERKEIKDALSYLKLLLNPHDDLALRRVINVPARGIGKGVMDALEQVDTGRESANLPPLLAGLAPRSHQLALDEAGGRHRTAPAQLTPGCVAERVSRSDHRDGRDGAARIGVRSPSAKCSISPATCGICARTRARSREGRIENLMELVSAAGEYESREPEPSLGGFVDRLSLLSDVDKEQGARDARVMMMTMHSAKGLEFPVVVIAGLEEGFSRTRDPRKTKRSSKKSAACATSASRARDASGSDERRTPARLWRLSEHRALALSRRRSRRTSSNRSFPAYSSPYAAPRAGGGWDYQARIRTAAAAAGVEASAGACAEHEESFEYEREDQSVPGGLRSGAKVRHGQFGVGTVLSVEQLDDDLKVIVRFVSVGTKTLRAKYAKLEMA